MRLKPSYILGAVRRPYLDISMPTGNGYMTRIVERPGKWMSDAELAALSEKLRAIASQTLAAGALTYGVFSGDAKRMQHSIITLVSDAQTGQSIAFNALAVIEADMHGQDEEVLHLGLVMVDRDVRSQGLSWILYGLTCILLWLRAGLRPLWISNVTQVPAIVGMVSDTFTNVAPRPGAETVQDFNKVLLSRVIMARHRHVFGVGQDAEFDEALGIIRNAYTGGSDDLKKTFDEAPKHRNAQINKFCELGLDYDRGDDFLQIGQIDTNAVRRFVMRSVPRGSLLAVLSLGGLVTLRRVVLPVLYWFDTKNDYGVLRSKV